MLEVLVHSVPRSARRAVSLLGAAALLALTLQLVTSLTPLTVPLAAAQAPVARETTRLPDATEFPSWERPLQFSKTYYVDGASPRADDGGPGTREQPFRTIGKAADVLQPGERVVIASGIYREVVEPKRGGTGPDRMISYEAADGATVVIRGSAVLASGWTPAGAGRGGVGRGGAGRGGAGRGRAGGAAQGRIGGGGRGQSPAAIWDVTLDGTWFGGYNPFGMMNMPQQRWQYMNRMSINVHNILVPYTRVRGMMFVDGKPLDQVRVASELTGRDPSWADPNRGQPYSAELFGELGGGLGKYFVDQSGLSLRVRLPNDDRPDQHLIEITTKPQVFAPVRGLGYIRVKGITFEHAGNNFPFPQTGMVSTNGGHHWIIEGNTFQWANSICLSVGGGGTTSHIIRGNTMRYCGISGRTGMGTSDLLVEDNLFEWIGWQDAEHMSESAGIKFHNARNLRLRNNVIRHMRHASGIWLDVGNVNCRLTRNVFTDILTAHAEPHPLGLPHTVRKCTPVRVVLATRFCRTLGGRSTRSRGHTLAQHRRSYYPFCAGTTHVLHIDHLRIRL
jgi:hypothetical protein